jgi:hypothetical protein
MQKSEDYHFFILRGIFLDLELAEFATGFVLEDVIFNSMFSFSFFGVNDSVRTKDLPYSALFWLK